MKKYDLLLKYLDLKICALRENNQDSYHEFMKQDDDNGELHHYIRGTHMGYDKAMETISILLDDFNEGKNEH